MFLQGFVGQSTTASMGPNTPFTLRGGQMGDLIVSEVQSRFYENTYRGNRFRTGTSSLLAINAATFQITTLGATATPIIGIWNPSSSSVNASVELATLSMTLTALAATGGGPYFWCVSTGNGAISTGLAPYNCKTLVASGSQCKGYAGTALTGLTNNLVVMCGSSLGGGSLEDVSFTATAVAMQTTLQGFEEHFDGSLIVPPGGVLALLGSATPAAHSCTSSLMWAEVPL